MRNLAAFLENGTHKLLLGFDVQTDHLIAARRPDLMIINQKKKKKWFCQIVDLAVPANHKIKLKECKKKDKYLDLARELKTTEHEGHNYTNRDCCFWYSN